MPPRRTLRRCARRRPEPRAPGRMPQPGSCRRLPAGRLWWHDPNRSGALRSIADQDVRYIAVAMDRYGRGVETSKRRGGESQFRDQPFGIGRNLGLCRRRGHVEVLDLVKNTLPFGQGLSRLEQAARGHHRIDDLWLQHPFERPHPPAVVQVLHDEDARLDVSQNNLGADTKIGCTLRGLEGTGYVDVKLGVAIHYLDENALAIRLVDGSPGEAVDASP